MQRVFSAALICTVVASATGARTAQIARVVYPAIYNVRFVDNLHGWLAGYRGLYYTADGGRSWLKQPVALAAPDKETRPHGPIGSIVDASPDSVVVVGSEGFLNWSLSRGIVRIVKPHGGVLSGGSLSFPDSRSGWAGGAGRPTFVSRTTDGGATWRDIGLPVDIWPQGLYAVSAQELWLFGNYGVMAHTTDGGATWSRISLPNSALFCEWFASATEGFAFGSYFPWDDEDDKGAFHTTDGGLTWNAIPLPIDSRSDLRSCSFHHAEGWAVGGYRHDSGGQYHEGALIIHTSDGGLTWDVQRSGQGNPLRGVVAVAAGRALAFDYEGTLLLTEDRGSKWRTVKLAE